MTEREHSHAHSHHAARDVDVDVDLGPDRRSSTLSAPARPLASGLLMRKATRDANGVADGAEAAVVSASASSGASLPAPIMRKFEAALGADLSSVRVHTGSASAEAASAVGARAYTIGQDIHFGAGQYDPGSAGGEHLLAHEVAHTVQQRGGSPMRQNKGLEVSTPHDAAEHEADRAADAMVAGQAATVGGASGLSRRIFRDAIDPAMYGSAAAAAERNAHKSKMEHSHASLQVLNASNVGDTQAAEAEVKKIQDQEEPFTEALHSAVVPEAVKGAYADNHRAMDTLSIFVANAGVQTTSLNNFKIHYQRLMLDFERLSVMVALSGISGEQSGDQFGEALVSSQKLDGADKAAATKDSTNPDAPGAGVLATKKLEVRNWEAQMTKLAGHLGHKEKAITRAQHEYLAACNDIASGLTPKSDPAAVTSFKALQATIDQLKGYAKLIAGFAAKSVGSAIGGLAASGIDAASGATAPTTASTGSISTTGQVVFDKTGMPMEKTTGSVAIKTTPKTKGQEWGAVVGDAAASQVPDVAAFVTNLAFGAAINEASTRAQIALETQLAQQKQQQLNNLQAKLIGIQTAAKEYVEDGVELERAKNQYRKVLMELAKALDTTGGRKGKKFQTLAAFLGEAEAYLAQSKVTREIGVNEKSTADNAKDKRWAITLATGKDECRWWDIKEEKLVASNGKRLVLGKHEVKLPTGAKAHSAAGGAEGDEGANIAKEKEMQRLAKSEKWIAQVRDRVKTEFSL